MNKHTKQDSSPLGNLSEEEKFFIYEKLKDPLHKHVWEKSEIKSKMDLEKPSPSADFEKHYNYEKVDIPSITDEQKDYKDLYEKLGFLDYEIQRKLNLSVSSEKENKINYHEGIFLEKYNNSFQLDEAISFLIKENNISLSAKQTMVYIGNYTFVVCELDEQGEVIHPLEIVEKITMTPKKKPKQLREQIKN